MKVYYLRVEFRSGMDDREDKRPIKLSLNYLYRHVTSSNRIRNIT